jgi:hypothetical protein
MRQSQSVVQTAALVVSFLWLVGSLLGILAWSFFDVVRFGYAILEAILGTWLPVAIWLLVPAFSLGQFIRLLILRDVKFALKWSVPAIVAACIFIDGADAGEYLRFEFYKATSQRVVADAAAGRCSTEDRKRWHADIDDIDCTNPVTAIFAWGGFGSSWYGVIYDATDQIVKAAPDRPMAWKHREIGSLLSCSGAGKALGNHFYLAGGNYTSGTNECG